MKKALFLLALIPSIALASHPHDCPSVKALKDGGINKKMFEDTDGHWYGGRSAMKYDTQYLWTFAILDVKASTNDKAFVLANLALKALSYQQGPTKGRTEDEVYCLYQAGKYSAVAISPPLADIPRIRISWYSYA